MLRVKRFFVTFNTSFVWHIENVISPIMSFSSIRDETSHTHVRQMLPYPGLLTQNYLPDAISYDVLALFFGFHIFTS